MPRPPSRILVQTELYPPILCGEGIFARNLARGLHGRGHEVRVLTASPDGSPSVVVDAGIEIHRLPSIPNPLYRAFRLSLPAPGRVARLLADFQPQAIQVNNPSATGSRLLGHARRQRLAALATNHYHPATASGNAPLLRVFGGLYERLAYRAMIRFYRQAPQVSAPSRAAADLLVRHGLERTPLVISNGIDIRRFHPGRRDASVFARYGIPAGMRTVLVHGRLHRSKQVALIAGAWHRTPEDVWLLASGEGPERVGLERAGFDRVRFAGHVDDDILPVLHASATAFAIASPHELQGIVLLEALASGTPAIGPAACAVPELVVPGITGELFAAGSPADFLARLLQLLDHRERYAAGARARAEEHDFERTLDRIEDVLLPESGSREARQGFVALR